MVAESPLTSSLNKTRVNRKLPVTGAGRSKWEMPVNMPKASLFPMCAIAVTLFAVPAAGDVIFEDPQPLHPSMLSDNSSDTDPQFAGDGQGNWLAAWWQVSSLVTSFSDDNGETWSAPALVHPSTTGVFPSLFSMNIATDRAGQWLLAVIIREIGVHLTRSEDNGLSWSTPLLIEPVARAFYPYLATDGDGAWVVMWSSANHLVRPTVANIRMSRSPDHGVTWSTPVNMDPTAVSLGSQSTLPRVIYDGAGHWVGIWATQWGRPDDHPEYGDDFDIMVSRSTDNWATWTTPTALNTDAATDGADLFERNNNNPDLATDGHGHWLAVWEKGFPPVLEVSRSSDNGATWTDPEKPPIPPWDGVHNVFPDLATDGQGEWIITWQPVFVDFAGDASVFDRLIMQMFSQDNGLTWSEPAPMYDVDAGLPQNPVSVIHDGTNSFLAIWWAMEDWGVEADIFIARGSTLGPGGAGGSSGSCFIATAAYGTPLAEDINTLRAVRDSLMLNNAVGAAFVDTYYRLSPPMADAVANNALLRAAVRTLLAPVVMVGSFVLAMPSAGLLLLFACVALAVSRIRRRMTRG